MAHCIGYVTIAWTMVFSADLLEDERSRLDPEVRRFVGIYDWAIQESKLPERMQRLIDELAADLELSEASQRTLKTGLPATLTRYRVEQATTWLKLQNVAQVNLEASTLRLSTHLVELSKSWRRLVSESLTAPEFKDWEATAAVRQRKAMVRLQRMAEIRRKRRQLSRASGIQSPDGVKDLRRAVALRRLSGDNVAPMILAAKKSVIERGKNFRAATRLEYELRILQLDFRCDLSKTQQKKLTLLIKGVLARRHAETDRAVDAYLDHLKDPRPADPEWGTKLHKLAPKASEDKSHRKFWAERLETVLTREQIALLPSGPP